MERFKIQHAFTLAEVLITIGIIGIVAAMTIPVIASHITHRRWQTQFKQTYSELNQAARTFYANEETAVHDYDSLAYADNNQNRTITTKNSNLVLAKYMSYFKGQTKDSNSIWRFFDSAHNIKNLSINGAVTNSYPCDQTYVMTDIKGRFYAMDDTSTSYKNLSYGPKICVDINGIDKPNRWGYDRFVFVFTEDNAVVPYIGASWSDISENLTEDSEIAKYCNSTTTTTPGHTCAYFALNDKSPDGNGTYWYNFLK